jgi:hypothetical protein
MSAAGTAGARPAVSAPAFRDLHRRRLLDRPLPLGGHALTLATGVAAATPVISSTVKAVQAGWTPAGDDGIIATRSWDVLTSHTPLVGQYSEAGRVIAGQMLHSPGPMLYWLLALPARLGSVSALPVTIGVVNTLSIAGCVILARRRGGLPLMFMTALAIALMCQSLAAEALHDIWNPAAALFPFLLLVFVCWSIACGDHRLLPIAVLLASFVTQTHLVYILPTAMLLAVAVGGLLLGWRRRRPRVLPWALSAFAIAVAVWTPPVIDQLENNPGNLTMIERSAEHRGPTLGATVGWHAVVRTVGVTPWWLYVPSSEWQRKAEVRSAPSGLHVGTAIAILVLLAAVGLAGVRGRRRDLAAAALIGLALTAAIGLAVAANPSGRLLSGTLGYTLWWASEVGMWVWLTIAWAAWLGTMGLARRYAAGARLASDAPVMLAAVRLASVAGVIGVASVGVAVASTARPDSHVYNYKPTWALANGIEQQIPAGRSIDYRSGPLDVATQPIEPALRFLLVRHGDRPLADGSLPRLGSYYVREHRPVQWILYVTDGTRPRRGMRLAARVGFASPWGQETVSAWVRRSP